MCVQGELDIYLEKINLLNYRNYPFLELELAPGMLLLEGRNGQGKSNLLESLYLLAIGKSLRNSADRELVFRDAEANALSQVSATLRRGNNIVDIQVNLQRMERNKYDTSQQLNELDVPAVHKIVRVNGVSRSTSGLVGEVIAVMFSAEDLDLITRSPSVRRKYLDILISQVDQKYLEHLRHYQKVIKQRNHLLKLVRGGRSDSGELEFWDDELSISGAYIVVKRNEILAVLSGKADLIYGNLAEKRENLELIFRPDVPEILIETNSYSEIFKDVIMLSRQEDVASGVTNRGPHRDDIQMILGGRDVSIYASRGQCRTVALSMRLSEAEYLREVSSHTPILLLDDVLSEMDSRHRSNILDVAYQYDQCIVTTADSQMVDHSHLSKMTRYLVDAGHVTTQNMNLKEEIKDGREDL